jgi:hypothetical protein
MCALVPLEYLTWQKLTSARIVLLTITACHRFINWILGIILGKR